MHATREGREFSMSLGGGGGGAGIMVKHISQFNVAQRTQHTGHS